MPYTDDMMYHSERPAPKKIALLERELLVLRSLAEKGAEQVVPFRKDTEQMAISAAQLSKECCEEIAKTITQLLGE